MHGSHTHAQIKCQRSPREIAQCSLGGVTAPAGNHRLRTAVWPVLEVLTQSAFVPQETLGDVWTNFGCHDWREGGVPLASSRGGQGCC